MAEQNLATVRKFWESIGSRGYRHAPDGRIAEMWGYFEM